MIKDAWADIRYQIFNIIDTEVPLKTRYRFDPFDTTRLTLLELLGKRNVSNINISMKHNLCNFEFFYKINIFSCLCVGQSRDGTKDSLVGLNPGDIPQGWAG